MPIRAATHRRMYFMSVTNVEMDGIKCDSFAYRPESLLINGSSKQIRRITHGRDDFALHIKWPGRINTHHHVETLHIVQRITDNSFPCLVALLCPRRPWVSCAGIPRTKQFRLFAVL